MKAMKTSLNTEFVSTRKNVLSKKQGRTKCSAFLLSANFKKIKKF